MEGVSDLQILQYVKPKSLEEAYTLLTKNKNNQIIAGMMWLKMQERSIPTGIDLSDLGLDQIKEDEHGFAIGAMTTLRELELHPGLNALTDGLFQSAFQDIVGVQFRNMATLGGSLFSRFGFSDILSVLLVLDCDVYLYHTGKVNIKDYAQMKYERDILTHIYIHKEQLETLFLCMRKSATDISTLNMAIAKTKDAYRISIGARPKRAMRFDFPLDCDVETMKQSICDDLFADNMRGSKAYRIALKNAFLEKAMKQLGGCVCR